MSGKKAGNSTNGGLCRPFPGCDEASMERVPSRSEVANPEVILTKLEADLDRRLEASRRPWPGRQVKGSLRFFE